MPAATQTAWVPTVAPAPAIVAEGSPDAFIVNPSPVPSPVGVPPVTYPTSQPYVAPRPIPTTYGAPSSGGASWLSQLLGAVPIASDTAFRFYQESNRTGVQRAGIDAQRDVGLSAYGAGRIGGQTFALTPAPYSFRAPYGGGTSTGGGGLLGSFGSLSPYLPLVLIGFALVMILRK